MREVPIFVVVDRPDSVLRCHDVAVRWEICWRWVRRGVIHPRNVGVWAVPIDVSLSARPALQVTGVENPYSVALPMLLAAAVVVRRPIRARGLRVAVVGRCRDP